MKELIKVMNQDGELLVSARDLHRGLEITERFNSWFNRQLQYGFEENVDFTGCKVFNALANQELDDYVLKLDMAKEICMLQRNDMGKSFRRYFIECEKQLRNQQQPLRIETVYSYSNYWIKRELNRMKPTDIPEYVNNLLEAAKNKKPNDRLITYQVARGALEDIQPTLIEPWQREMVQASLNKLNNLIDLQKTYINRSKLGSKTKRINRLELENEELKNQIEDDIDWKRINNHSFTENCRLEYSHDLKRMVRSKAYNAWRSNFDYSDFRPLHCDPSKPMTIYLHFGKLEKFDTSNLEKTAIDMIADRYQFDDNLIVSKVTTSEIVDSYAEGFILFDLINEDDNNDR